MTTSPGRLIISGSQVVQVVSSGDGLETGDTKATSLWAYHAALVMDAFFLGLILCP